MAIRGNALKWLANATAQGIVGAVIGSAAVTGLADVILNKYYTLSGAGRFTFWSSIMFLSFLGFTWVLSKLPWMQPRLHPADNPKNSEIPVIPESWTPWYNQPLTIVHHKTFENLEVPLDGYKYEHCKFKNVTFQITGAAPFGFLKPEISGSVNVVCTHPASKSFLTMQDFIALNFPGQFRGGIQDD